MATGPKLLALFALFYLVFPFDLVPDIIPVLGWLDDVGLSALAFVLLARAWKHYATTPPSAGDSGARPAGAVEAGSIDTTGTDVSAT